jgi:hypothetical protein
MRVIQSLKHSMQSVTAIPWLNTANGWQETGVDTLGPRASRNRTIHTILHCSAAELGTHRPSHCCFSVMCSSTQKVWRQLVTQHLVYEQTPQ